MSGRDLPTFTMAQLGTRAVVIERRPELAHEGVEFIAYFSGNTNGISAVASTETGSLDALAEADREESARRQDLAEHGVLPWYLA